MGARIINRVQVVNAPEESLQERSYREWRENFARVSADPESASITDLMRAIGYLDHRRNSIQRHAWEQSKTVDANVIAGYDNEQDYYQRLIEQKQGRRNPAPEITDRALRYRANAEPPAGEKICAFCGSRRNVEVGHVDGFEEHTEPENLIWTCRACNTRMGIAFRNRGRGRRTRQYNPGGAKSLGAWMNAVMAMRGQSSDMSVSDAVALIHDTPASTRSRFAREIWNLRREHGTDRTSEVPF